MKIDSRVVMLFNRETAGLQGAITKEILDRQLASIVEIEEYVVASGNYDREMDDSTISVKQLLKKIENMKGRMKQNDNTQHLNGNVNGNGVDRTARN